MLTAVAFLLAGFVKGVIGMGMPTVSLALLSLGMGLPAAVQIVVVPTFVTNVWQALIGDGLRRLLKRFRSLLVATIAGVWIGYFLLFRTHPEAMTALLGAAIGIYALSGLFNVPLMPRVKREALASPVVGLTTGVLAGATGNISMPAIAYLHRLNLPRNDIVQMLGILFTLGAAALGFTLAGHGNYQPELLALSALAVIPGVTGMFVGQKVRGRLSERTFRRALFCGLLLAAAHLMWKGLR
ncbi:MAG: sulfite exporter TauE/SafE family protein [Burkholderiales bacterium]|nr:sulfite exporter TauE/SafE family protein [Burkholderiales bacterium]